MPRRKNNKGGAEEQPYQIPEPTVLSVPNQEQDALNNIPSKQLEYLSNKEKLALPLPIQRSPEIFLPQKESTPVFTESSTFKSQPIKSPINSKMLFYVACGVSFISFILLIVGLYVLLRPPKFKKEIEAIITAASCNAGICSINISYTVNNTFYVQNNISVHRLYSPGQSILIDYDENNPKSFILTPPQWVRPFIGGGVSLLAIVIFVSIWWYYSMRI